MGDDCLTVRKAWAVYDQWLSDPKVEIRAEAPEIEDLFRQATLPFAKLSAPKVLGDCYLLAVARALQAKLVTLDRAFLNPARLAAQDVLLLG